MFGWMGRRSERRSASGRGLWAEAFDQAALDGLKDAMDTLAGAYPSPVVGQLEASLGATTWAKSRAAVNGLRDARVRGMCAAPSVAAWVILGASERPDDYGAYGLREGAIALADWRIQARDERVAARGAHQHALARLVRFLDEEVEPAMCALLCGPRGRVQRGALRFVRTETADPAAVLKALQAYTQHDPPADDGDYVYGHADGIRALQQIAERLERATAPQASTVAAGLVADSPSWDEDSDEDGPDTVDTTEHSAGAEDHDADDPEPDFTHELLTHTLIRLASDPAPEVRVRALEGMRRAGLPRDAVAQVALEASRDPEAAVRAAAAELLAALLR